MIQDEIGSLENCENESNLKKQIDGVENEINKNGDKINLLKLENSILYKINNDARNEIFKIEKIRDRLYDLENLNNFNKINFLVKRFCLKLKKKRLQRKIDDLFKNDF